MTSSTSEELPRLGRYQVINKIAAGGMAEVFLAKAVGAMGFQRLVAVKLIHANFTRDQEFVKMFIDEARIAMHLHHRNIVQVFDLDKANDTYFIAMEFVHGVNLYDLYERIASKGRWIEPSMALYLVAELSKGLHFAHTRKGPDGRPLGIIHRDISPQNILLSFEGEVKITDFGIATAAERLHQTAAGIVKGKYAYMAPERLQEKPTDGRVDVFSAGVLLYELLVGENPFAGSSAVETIENVLNKKLAPPSERGAPVAQALDRITLKALARDPKDRFASAQDLADALTEYALEVTSTRKDMAAGDGTLAALLAELFPEKAKRPPGVTTDPKGINLPGVDVKVQTVQPEEKKANGRSASDLVRTQEEGPTSESGPSPHADPADEDLVPDDPDMSNEPTVAAPNGMDEPTILRMSPPGKRPSSVPMVSVPPQSAPLSPRSAKALPTRSDVDPSLSGLKPRPMVIPRARRQSRDEEYTDRNLASLNSDPSGFTTLPPYPSGADEPSLNFDTDKSIHGVGEPQTPVSEEAIDKTTPTELPPSMMQVPRRPVVSDIDPPSSDSLAALSDPDLPKINYDGFAPTLQTRTSFQPEDDGLAGLIVQPAQPQPQPQSPLPPQPAQQPQSRPTYSLSPPGRSSQGPQHGSNPPLVQPAMPSSPQMPMPHGPGGNRLAPIPRSGGDSPISIEPPAMYGTNVDSGSNLSPSTPQAVSSYPLPQPPPRSMRTTTIIAILLFIIAILVVFAAVLVVRERERSGPPRTAPITLRVTTTPPGAKVTIDGLEQQGTTPFSGPVSANDDHMINVSLAGYADPQVKKIHPPEGMAAQVHFDLVPLRGSIAFQVTPPDALVYINDQERGTGNVTISDLPLGVEIVVRVEAKGFKTVEQKIVLESEMRDITMPVVLSKGKSAPPTPRNEGRLRRVQLVAPFGSWATLYYKNRWLGTTPTYVQLPVGEVQLRVVNESQKIDKQISVIIPESGSDQVTLNLR